MRKVVFLALLAASLLPAAIASAETPAEKQMAQTIGQHLKEIVMSGIYLEVAVPALHPRIYVGEGSQAPACQRLLLHQDKGVTYKLRPVQHARVFMR